MAVLSKVLYGEINRVSVDLCEELDEKKRVKKKSANSGNLQEKKKFIGNVAKKNTVKTGEIIRLNPSMENVHYLEAKTNCILFDVLMPNYDNSYRMCHFYKEIDAKMPVAKKIKGESSENLKENLLEKIFLAEIEEPPEIHSFIVVGFPRFLSLGL